MHKENKGSFIEAGWGSPTETPAAPSPFAAQPPRRTENTSYSAANVRPCQTQQQRAKKTEGKPGHGQHPEIDTVYI